MSDARPHRPPTDAERYASALRRVLHLRERHPELHEAVLFVIGKQMGDCHAQFFKEEFNPTEAAKIHTRFRDLEGVLARLANPAPFIKGADAKPAAPAGGGLREGVEGVLRLGRAIRDRMRGAKAKAETAGGNER